MYHSIINILVAVAVIVPFAASSAQTLTPEGTQTKELAGQLDRATSRLGNHEYLLRYRFRPGETMGYEVEHLVSVKTTIEGSSQTQQSRSRSRKVWKVSNVSAKNEATFSHSIEYVNMWSESQGLESTKYDSRTDKKPPAAYESVAESLGKPLSLVTVDELGKILDRDDKIQQIDFGTGGLLVPLPDKKVKIGEEWSVSNEVPVRLEDGTFKSIKTRQRYRLDGVSAGIASISLQTQILTPSITPRVRSQLIQKLSNGQIKFDIEAGRIVSKQLEWDESVVGFNGPSSNMAYLGRISETLDQEPRTASASNKR